MPADINMVRILTLFCNPKITPENILSNVKGIAEICCKINKLKVEPQVIFHTNHTEAKQVAFLSAAILKCFTIRGDLALCSEIAVEIKFDKKKTSIRANPSLSKAIINTAQKMLEVNITSALAIFPTPLVSVNNNLTKGFRFKAGSAINFFVRNNKIGAANII